MTAARKERGVHTRSRSGCRTCRIRRVKCDETPKSCQRCASSGRKCEGYDVMRLPWRTKRSGIAGNNGHRILEGFKTVVTLSPPGCTTDEKRSFIFFQACTVPMMNSWFDHELWDQVFLQLSLAEPSIFHAVVAVAAVHEDIRVTNDILWSKKNDIGGHRQFALEQYGRAMSALNSRMMSNDPQLRNTVLLCCYLFIVFELIFGNCDVACEHLQKGIEILRRPERLEDENPVSRSLINSMRHLADQAVYFGKSNMHAHFDAATPYLQSHLFVTVADAVEARNWILREISGFLDFAYPSAEETLFAWQQRMRVQLIQFKQLLDRLEGELRLRCEDRGVAFLSHKEQRGVHVLQLHHALFSLRIDLCTVNQMHIDVALLGTRFSEIVERCESIASLMCDGADEEEICGQQASHLMEIGIIQPLHYICKQCVDQRIVQRARNVLERWPHREGLWTSRLALRLASETAS